MPKNLTRTGQNAIKHGAYSNLGLLPGEDAKEFLKLHALLHEEFAPSGPIEEDAVHDLTKLVWRKQMLGVYQRVKSANTKWGTYLMNKDDPDFDLGQPLKRYFLDIMKPIVEAGPNLLQKQAEQEQNVDSALKELNAKVLVLISKQEMAHHEDIVDTQAVDLHLALVADTATPEGLVGEIELLDHIDARIERVLKRLMQLKAMKPAVGLGPNVARTGR